MGHFLKRFCSRYHIVLHKGENLHILLTLAWNRVLLFKLRLHKWLHGIRRPIVHYYAVCWNEEKMLPFMFDYYERFVDCFTIYDNYSDDNSEAIIKSKHAKIVKFKSEGFDDAIHQKIKDNCWKRSRGKADFVIVCDIDEFLYHSDLKGFLQDAINKGDTIFETSCFDMYSQDYPKYDGLRLITEQLCQGVRNEYNDKSILFDPHRIVEIVYEVGAHRAYPLGIVKRNNSNGSLKILHYKYLSLEHVVNRMKSYLIRLSDANKEHGWGEEYQKNEDCINKDFYEKFSQCRPIIKL